MIVIRQEPPSAGLFDMPPQRIDREVIAVAIGREAAAIPDMPAAPQYGLGADGPTGPWYAYYDFNLCAKWIEATGGTVVITIPGEKEEIQIALECSAINLSTKESKDGKPKVSPKMAQLKAKMMNTVSLHVIVYLDNGELFRYVTPTMIATAFERANFMVLKKNRAQLKVDGQAVRGKSGNTEAIHLNIRPLEGSFFGAFYPPLLAVPYRDTMLEVRYVICSHPDLEGFIHLDGCHQYFADTMERYGNQFPRSVWYPCLCHQPSKGKGKGKGKPSHGGMTGKQALEKQVAERPSSRAM